MMMINDSSKKDLRKYISKTVWSAFFLHVVLLALALRSYYFGSPYMVEPFLGGFFGALIATINLFAIGYAFYILAIKKGKRWALLWPIGSFLVMCAMAYVFAIFRPSMIMGFALGLTAPVLFGGVLVFLDKDNPLDLESK